MDITEEQKVVVGKWIEDGLGLSDIQKRLSDELGVSMTYMDVRFMVLDLGLDVQDKVVAKPVVDPVDGGDGAGDLAGNPGDDLAGGVSIEVDRIMKPGSVVSGTVVFSDGVSASWMLDQMGRLALDAGTPDYRPSESDLAAFQQELKSALEKKGF
ncbi:MAG: hypothetical protein KAH23_09055 [Kiritimatiellae bacterium]|nr:hypothetical protein [Kiritimatiellia bacterium]